MKRKTLHIAFAAAAGACAAGAAWQAWALHSARDVNAAIARSSVPGGAAVPADTAIPQARFARAVALDRTGDQAAALKIYKDLARTAPPALARAALYNQGNLQLRSALTRSGENAADTLPLIELAKQAYRDLLRADPGFWDARYNLERALRLAPETADAPSDSEPPIEKERAVTTMRAPETELP